MSKIGQNLMKVLFIVVCSFGAGFGAHYLFRDVLGKNKPLAIALLIAGVAGGVYKDKMLGRLVQFEY